MPLRVGRNCQDLADDASVPAAAGSHRWRHLCSHLWRRRHFTRGWAGIQRVISELDWEPDTRGKKHLGSGRSGRPRRAFAHWILGRRASTHRVAAILPVCVSSAARPSTRKEPRLQSGLLHSPRSPRATAAQGGWPSGEAPAAQVGADTAGEAARTASCVCQTPSAPWRPRARGQDRVERNGNVCKGGGWRTKPRSAFGGGAAARRHSRRSGASSEPVGGSRCSATCSCCSRRRGRCADMATTTDGA